MRNRANHFQPSRLWLTCAPILAPSLFATAAVAQVQPPTREELRPVPVAPPPPRDARLTVEGDMERAPCPLADPRNANITVTVNDVAFNNLKGMSIGELRPSFERFLGKPQPVAVLCEIRDAAATALRERGYLAAVQVPTQTIENGTVRLEVLYGRVTAIRVRGDATGAERKLAAVLGRLTEDEIFDRRHAERYLLLARDLPGYDVRLTLKPAGTAPGDLIGEVTVQRAALFVDASVQNLAASETGRWGGQMRAQFNGLTGLGDATAVSFYATSQFSEQKLVQITHEMRPGTEGLTLGGQLTFGWTKPDLNAPAGTAALRADTLFATLEGSYPLIRSQGRNLRLAGGMDFLDQKVKLLVPLSRDKLRVAYLRADFDAIDLSRPTAPGWRMAATAELRKGLDLFGASPDCSAGCAANVLASARPDGKPTGTAMRGMAELEVAAASFASFLLRGRGQLAFDPLFSFEEFAGGNYTVGRGYAPATIIGDSGLGLQAELRGPRIDIGARATSKLQPYAFVDRAWVWNRNDGSSKPEHLTSAGGGIRMEIDRRARLDLGVAVPLERAGIQATRGNPRIMLTFTTRLFPWGD